MLGSFKLNYAYCMKTAIMVSYQFESNTYNIVIYIIICIINHVMLIQWHFLNNCRYIIQKPLSYNIFKSMYTYHVMHCRVVILIESMDIIFIDYMCHSVASGSIKSI